jgi:PucR family transcriptional regulator, purine catabolism regulatory protein
MALTLGDLLDEPDFRLTLRTGGRAAAAVPVHGAHSIDVPDPVRWLPEHWVMLTTGLGLRGRVAEQRRLVAQLSDGGIAALGFGLEVVVRDVPAALLDEARRREFPVFTVPLDVPFREIMSFVNRSALSADLHDLRRVVSIQDYLLDALHTGAPERTLLERLRSVLGGGELAVVGLDGRVVAAIGVPPPGGWPVPDRPGPARELRAGGRRALAAPVADAAAQEAWLVAVLGSEGASRQVAKPVVRTAARLVALLWRLRGAAREDRRRRTRRLLEALLAAPAGPRAAPIARDLAAEGLDLAAPCRTAAFRLEDAGPARVVAQPARVAAEPARAAGARSRRPHGPQPGRTAGAPSGQHDAQPALLAAADLLDAHEVPAAVAVVDGTVAALVQHDLAGLDGWLADLAARGVALRAGVGGPTGDAAGVRRSLREARLAVAAASGPRRAVHHAELDVAAVVVGAAADPALRARLRRELAPLDGEPRLREALVAYFDAGLNVGRAAHALGLHPNSLRYRLSRVESRLGRSLSDPAAIAALHLALVAARTGGSAGADVLTAG